MIVGIRTTNVAFVSRTNKLPVRASDAARLVRPAYDTRFLWLPLSLSVSLSFASDSREYVGRISEDESVASQERV